MNNLTQEDRMKIQQKIMQYYIIIFLAINTARNFSTTIIFHSSTYNLWLNFGDKK